MPSDSLVHASSGALGGICAMAITYPLISVSTRAQVESRKGSESSVEAALALIRKEGVRSLYDGLSSSLIGIAVTNGIYYLFFEESRAMLLKAKKSSKPILTTLESMLAGAIAGSMTSIISNPIWVVNTRQTVRQRADSTTGGSGEKKMVEAKKMGFLKTIMFILKTDGPAAFFRGLGPALILVMNPILQFTLFEQLKNFLLLRRTSRLPPLSSSATSPRAPKSSQTSTSSS